MSKSVPIPGWVKANGGDTPRRASTIVYTIAWDFPSGPVDWDGCKPHDQRPPDQINGKDVETTPLSVGSWVVGVLINDSHIWWSAHERVAFAECGGAAPSGSTSKKIMTGPGGEILPDDGGQGGGTTIPGQGAGENPGSGGEVGVPQ